MSTADSTTTYTPIPLTPELAPLMEHNSPEPAAVEEKKKLNKLLDTPAHVLLLLKAWLGFSQVERWQIEEEEARILLLGDEEEEEEEDIGLGEEDSGSGESDGEVEF